MIKEAVVIFAIFINFARVNSAVMEAVIQIDSDNFRMSSFLQRFKNFIARSHGESSLLQDENPWMQNLVQYNDTFQANYDFSRNLLTMISSYSLLINGTDQKISDVKITINFKFNQDKHEKILLQDIKYENIPKIEHQKNRIQDCAWSDLENGESNSKSIGELTILGRLLSPVINVIEPIIVAFVHIIVNGVLGHVLTTAFDQLYNGRLITI